MGLLYGIYLRLKSFILFFLVIVLIPNVPPKTEFPFSSHRVANPLDLSGPLAMNDYLDRADLLFEDRLSGPEHLLPVGNDIYTGLNNGELVRITGDHITHVARFGSPSWEMKTGGRPLGIVYDQSRNQLIVADAYFGIWAINLKDESKEQLVGRDTIIEGDRPRKAALFNSVALASNGDIYFTDSSSDFGLEDGMYTVMANPSGRLIHYDRKKKVATTLIDELGFANGLLLSPDEEFIVVAETQRAQIIKYYLKGTKKGLWEPFVVGLPGHPDNLTPSSNGFWVPLVISRDSNNPSLMASLTQVPLVRKFLIRLLYLGELPFRVLNQIFPNEYLQTIICKWGHFSMFNFAMPPRQTLVKVDWSGNIVGALHGMNKRVHTIAHVSEIGDYLYLGSPFTNYIGRIKLDAATKRMLKLGMDQ